jgi:ribose transport system permease protein
VLPRFLGPLAFLSFRNFTAVASQGSILLLASTGATFVILMGRIDLSVGAIVLLVGAVVVTAINGLDLGLSALLVGILYITRHAVIY